MKDEIENPYAKKPWLKFYDEHVPPNLEYPDTTFVQLFREAVDQCAERVALYYMGTAITFGELDVLSNKFAHFLKESGVTLGDVVGVNLPNIPAFYIAVIGVQKAGCVFSGVSPLLSPEELEYQLNDSEAKVLVTLDALFGNVQQVAERTGVRAIAVAEMADFLSATKRVVGRLLKKVPTGTVDPIPGIEVKRLRDILANTPGDRIEEKVPLEAPIMMQYTGGTTGPPKGAILDQKNFVCHFTQIRVWLDSEIGEDTVVSAFPMFHHAGLFLAKVCMLGGLTQVAIPNPRDLDFLISAIKKYRPTGIANVPTVYLELLKKPAFRELDFSGVKWFLSGAMPFPAEYLKEFDRVVGEGKLLEVFGMTETNPITTSQPRYGLKKPGSVGIPYPDTEVKLVDPETGEIVPVGTPGEFVAKGPQVFTAGYHGRPEETARTLRDEWIYTGDVCRMDEDGYFYVVDRLKDMVIVSGYKVFTRTVDDSLMEHPGIDVAATVGLPDPKRPGSETVAAAIVLKPGMEKSEETREEITRYMREKVAPYKVPKRIDFMDALPTSGVGKVLKRELREMMKKSER
jgi:acyl-CoA synthetase (AMP-forming)/AMP-acid ligase II